MPVILDPKVKDDWINPRMNEKEHLLKLLDYKYNDYLDFYQVSAAINSPRNNNKETLRKVL